MCHVEISRPNFVVHWEWYTVVSGSTFPLAAAVRLHALLLTAPPSDPPHQGFFRWGGNEIIAELCPG
jgi:hypothetical protein